MQWDQKKSEDLIKFLKIFSVALVWTPWVDMVYVVKGKKDQHPIYSSQFQSQFNAATQQV